MTESLDANEREALRNVDRVERDSEDKDSHWNAPAPEAPAEVFRKAMGCFATGVTVVTTVYGDKPYGLTVSAFCSVSLNPPLLLISLQKTSQTLIFIRKSGCFAVNMLTTRQQALAVRFAQKDARSKAFSDIPHHRGSVVSDVALFDEAQARVECRVASVYPAGDHVLFLGRVMAIEFAADERDREPLVYYRAAFRALHAERL